MLGWYACNEDAKDSSSRGDTFSALLALFSQFHDADLCLTFLISSLQPINPSPKALKQKANRHPWSPQSPVTSRVPCG